jgi:hypothetical protein
MKGSTMNENTMKSPWRRLDDTYRSWSKTKRLITFLVAFALVVGVSAGVTALIQDKANATAADAAAIIDTGDDSFVSEPPLAADQKGICQPGGHPDLQCLTSSQLVTKFKNGKLGRRAAFVPADYFTNPAEFKQDAHDKMVVFLHNHPKAEGELRAKYLTKDPGCTDNCLAWKMYSDLMASSNCGPAVPIGIDPNTCKGFETGHKKAVERGITIAYCGGALVLGAVGAFSTDGVAAPAVATIYGGIGCGWGFMSSFFN